MRIITGTKRGMRLKTLPGQVTRPTAAKVKEAVFSTIQFEIENAEFLDLYAGSAQMGIEALSRGALSCVFVENSRECAKNIRDNLEHCDFLRKSKIVINDVFKYLKTSQNKFDIVFADPPYKNIVGEKLLDAIIPHVNSNGVIIIECDAHNKDIAKIGDFELHSTKKYAKTKICMYRIISQGE